MPMPKSVSELHDQLADVQTQVEAVDTALAALPGTPLEADLPDIVQIVADLTSTTTALKSIVDTIATVIATTRMSQGK